MSRHLAPYTRPALPVALLPIALIACAHQRGMAQSSGGARAAVAEVNGVRVAASTDSWKGKQSQQFTPVQVTIENHSGRTLQVAYHDFSLRDEKGAPYLPLVAMRDNSRAALHGSLMGSAAYQPMAVYAPSSEPCGRQDRLVDAPYQAYSYVGPLPSGNVFPYASTSGASTSGDSCSGQLPTPQMVTEALPEKPLRSEAHAEGFVYFQAQSDRGSPAQLAMDLVDAATGQSFGRVELHLAARN